ncbi:hypothetical protein PR048_010683 [Dryococelus australis]|uniref:Uncharacterized protein n=1 Tax=Dryococelus australis TaxID=614101 RepID=A0ABQ9I3D9_9NEOP|nr:hypothetical protein PR048_010683 [Dryococelus australis]
MKRPIEKITSSNSSFMGISTAEKKLLKIMQTDTKITKRNDQEDFRSPICLPSGHPLIELIIREKHVRVICRCAYFAFYFKRAFLDSLG